MAPAPYCGMTWTPDLCVRLADLICEFGADGPPVEQMRKAAAKNSGVLGQRAMQCLGYAHESITDYEAFHARATPLMAAALGLPEMDPNDWPRRRPGPAPADASGPQRKRTVMLADGEVARIAAEYGNLNAGVRAMYKARFPQPPAPR